MEQEIWKTVKGYEGMYEVSDIGRVKSLPRLARYKSWKRGVGERILKIRLNRGGYPVVDLHNDGIQKTVSVHQLMAIAFLGHSPNGYSLVVDHIDGQKTHNYVENFRLVTNRFNCTLGVRRDRYRLTSKYVGVSWRKHRKKWRSQITIEGKQKQLGEFKNEVDAANAYLNELSKLPITPLQ